jgi:hypothetical protein
MQHDECRSSLVFRLAKKTIRDPKPDAPLPTTVIERFLAVAVPQYDEMKRYRPDALRDHIATNVLWRPSAAVADRMTPVDNQRRGRGVLHTRLCESRRACP